MAHWTADLARGVSIQDIAKGFLASEESDIRTAYHEEYSRDIDDEGLEYWMTHTGTEEGSAADLTDDTVDFTDHDAFNAAELLRSSLTARDNEYEQVETGIRDLLSNELGLHSTDAQRDSDFSLRGSDGISGTADDVFTSANNEMVERMRKDAAKIAEANK